MANTKWQVKGDYFETCSCDYLCPCVSSDLAARPTQGYCAVAMVFHIDQGQYGGTQLNNLSFAVLARTPEEMGKGNWSVGVITDDRATSEQQQALVAIAS